MADTAGRDSSDGPTLERAEADTRRGVLTPPSSPALRAELESLVLADLLGPAGGPEEEVDESRVSDRYLVGMLAPRRQPVSPEGDEDLPTAGDPSTDEGADDPGITLPDSMFPSSLGLTFSVAREAPALRVTVRWGRYEKRESAMLLTEAGNPKKVWRRVPVEGVSGPIPLRAGPIPRWAPCPEQPEVTVQGLVREGKQEWIVSLFLVNGQTKPEKLSDRAWVFQPELLVEAADGSAVFLQRDLLRDRDRMDPAVYAETAEMAMLYRRQLEFAVGHGVAVHADTPPGNPWRAVRLSTRSVPSHEVPQQTPPTAEDPGFEGLSDLILDMKVLASTADADFAAKLNPLADAYRAWIEAEQRKIDDPAERLGDHRDAAEGAIRKCRRTLDRIREGIALLGTDEKAAEAFRFANRAMWLQRIRSILAERVRRGESASLDEIDADARNHTWYPFQLAFILLALPSATDLHHKDRSDGAKAVADLLWFPTGGGKTEAYLGLAAYVMTMRRLQGVVGGRPGASGVSVLMRYTLRLLTIQQFQRASALACACESIRREALAAGDTRWGEEPFRIGLWVGQKTTPNSTDDSAEAVERGRDARGPGAGAGARGSPAQLTNCPWCGTKIDKGRDIVVERGPSTRCRTFIYCGDRLGRCLFSRRSSPEEGLPVLVVDEEIYRLLPALLIATVDKFAQMPWEGRTQMLFGRVNGLCPRHGFRSPEVDDADSHPKRGSMPAVKTIPCGNLRPPDLIIQDELHLISGPLGTLVGLYETAVDELASWEVDGRRVRPKVVASTATIRNALSQVNSLFLRGVEVFPPPGTDAANNFFSLQREPGEGYPGRRYLGICALGKRLKAVFIRVYVAHLAAAQRLFEKYGAAADPWMTLVGYFCTIRELAGMRRLVEDDVRTRLKNADARGMARRRPPVLEEMTSRKASTDIPEILDRLEIPFVPGRPPGAGPEPLDVLLATNMLSVGVDVKRLGLMVVGGQPKTAAEYIQATSRIGRRVPGLVCTVYNWARPRDLSHYERFEHYHATFYEQVESLSLTPFAPRALDRGLTALLVALARLEGEELNENGKAGTITRDHPFVKRAIEAIRARAEAVTASRPLGAEVRAGLDQRLDVWLARARGGSGGAILGYKAKRDGVTTPLLRRPDEDRWDTYTCLTSLREVEPQVGLILVEDGLGTEGTKEPDETPGGAIPDGGTVDGA